MVIANLQICGVVSQVSGWWSGGRARAEEENMLLYVGLGMAAVGLALTFVGEA